MFGLIKDIFRKRCLGKVGGSIKTGFLPLSGIRSAAVVIDAEEKGATECKKAVLSRLREENIRADVLFFDFGKKSKEERQITSLHSTLLKKDLNWCGKPPKDKANMLNASEPDLFISLIDNVDFPIAYLAKCSTAKFKIGRRQLPNSTFDLVIDDSPAGTSQEEVFLKMLEFLRSVKP